ncbi:MAG: VOC family protein [Hyphomonas sp.]
MSSADRFENRNMTAAAFCDCAMAGATFRDVNLSQATFNDVSLKGATFTNINLSGAAIDDANIEGLTIDGHDIEALIGACEGGADRAAPLLGAAEPQLFVTDLERACGFYTGRLGFEVAFTYGTPAFYAQIVREGVRLNLRLVPAPLIDPDRVAAEAILSASIVSGQIDELYREFQEAGVAFHEPLMTQDWSARTFIIRDPDGNLVLFAGT